MNIYVCVCIYWFTIILNQILHLLHPQFDRQWRQLEQSHRRVSRPCAQQPGRAVASAVQLPAAANGWSAGHNGQSSAGGVSNAAAGRGYLEPSLVSCEQSDESVHGHSGRMDAVVRLTDASLLAQLRETSVGGWSACAASWPAIQGTSRRDSQY